MRLLKRQTTNLRSIAGKGVQYDIDDQVIIDSQRAMIVPKGPDHEQPGYDGSDPAHPNPVLTTAVNGQIRYNTDDDQLEAYQNGAWREIRFKEPNRDPGIHWQKNLGTGDAVETVFGELQSNDPDFPVPASSEHILVLIENVLQIPGTNYNIRQTAEVDLTGPNAPYTSTGTGWWIEFTSAVPFGKDVTVVHNFDK